MLLRRLYWTGYLALSIRGQARYPFRPLAAIRGDQERRVRRMVAYAWRHVPYYRETMRRLSLTPGDFRTADDLAKLPVIERAQLQRDPEYFASTAQRLNRCVSLRTSGSTGAPIEVLVEPRALIVGVALNERVRSIVARIVGRRAGYRETRIVSEHDTTAKVHQFCVANTLVPAALSLRRQSLSLHASTEELAAQIEAFKPHVLATYGSGLSLLFPYFHARRQACHRPKVILYGADALPDSVRRLIEDEFGIPVFSCYQCVEASYIAFECEQHRGLHQHLDACAVRIADGDGRSLPVGETGDVIVSNLLNRATVLLNYRLGDLAALLPDPCPCGRSLPLMSQPKGRCDDAVRLPSGRIAHPLGVTNAFRCEGQVWQYQVVQESPERFVAKIVAAPEADRAALAARIAHRLAEALEPGVATEVAFVDAIDRQASGKFRAVVSLVPR